MSTALIFGSSSSMLDNLQYRPLVTMGTDSLHYELNPDDLRAFSLVNILNGFKSLDNGKLSCARRSRFAN